MKIGIMGGTFNPVHNGHLALATAAKEAAGLDEVWFMPSGLPAHKSNTELLSSELRLAMVKLAVQEIPGFLASSFETDRPGFTYTADTIESLAQEYPEHEFFFIIGGDSLMKFHHWVKPAVISAHATLLAAGRDEFSEEELEQQAESLYRMFHTKIQLVSMAKVDISSNEIRNCIKTGQLEKVKQFLPEQVFQLILEQQLYR